MEKSFLIARSNLRKAKGQTAAIIALILSAALMLNLWLMLSMDYKRNFERYHDALHAEHITLALSEDSPGLRDFASEALDGDSRVEEYSIDGVLAMVGSFPYGDGQVNTEFIVLEKEEALRRSIGKIEIVEDSQLESGIYLPMLYGSGGQIAIGDAIDITIGNYVASYRVCGFLNSIMAGSHNCGMSALLFTEDKYKELEEKGVAPKSALVSVRIYDKAESESVEASLKNAISSKYPSIIALSNSYVQVSSSRYISQMICSGIVSAMAFFVTLIALVVISSNVANYIQENMRDLGAWKAIGYTSGQLIFSLLLQFVGIALVTAMLGAGLSYVVFPKVNEMMISQTGIPYAIRFLPLPFLASLGIISGTVALAVWLSARKIKKIEPIVALRQGMQTHSFQTTHIPLGRTKLPLNLALALKTTLSGVRQNATICITMLVLSLVIVFSGLMAENVIVDLDPFIHLIVGETADSCININQEIEDSFLKAMEENPQVEKAYLYHSVEVRHVGGTALAATLADDFGRVNNQDVVYEGRFPKFDNEVAIAGKYAKEQGLEIGDEIALTAEGKEANYLISGFTQISNNLGKDCLLTRDGYERMGGLTNASYYINLAEGTDIEAFHEEAMGQFGSDVNAVVNIISVVSGTAAVYVSLMTVIVLAVLVLSMAVVTFVLYLLVRTMINGKKRDYGILKALGFTTGQLVLQTAASFMPAVAISTVAGIAVSAWIINPLTAFFLRGIGIVKCSFAVPMGLIAGMGAGVALFAFGMACLLSFRIRKIAPRALLSGD